MSVQVIVPNPDTEAFFRLLVKYASCSCDIKITCDGKERNVMFTSEEGKVLSGSIAAARYIASKGTRCDQLLGSTNEDRSKVSEIMTLTRGMIHDQLDGQLELFNAWLQSRTFLVGHNITLADLVLYAGVSKAVSCFPIAQHVHFRNLMRWYENIHFMVDEDNLFPGIVFSKPRFSFAPAQQVVGPAKQTKISKGEKKSAEPPKEESDKKDRKEEKEKRPAADKPPKKEKSSSKEDPTVDFLDIRVGLIKSIGPHPNADALYVEEIDVGEEKPRTVVSGLRKFVSEEDMKDRMVAVICNLKPAKMRDIVSYGMVLCASNADHTQVDPIIPPEGSTIGSRIMVEGFDREPEAQIHPKKKIFERIAPELSTDAGMSGCKMLCIMMVADAKKFHAKSDRVNPHVDMQLLLHQDLF